jgi:hypothetical protein
LTFSTNLVQILLKITIKSTWVLVFSTQGAPKVFFTGLLHVRRELLIAVPLHGLIYSKDGSMTYFIRRFDRVGNNKIAVEDFSQAVADLFSL